MARGVRGFVVLGGEGRSGNQSVKRHRFVHGKQVQAGCGSQVLPGSGTLRSSSARNGRNTIRPMWYMIGLLLTTDDVVMLRTVARRWNVGKSYGALGDTFFSMWHCDSDGRRVHTLSRKRIPIMYSTRRRGLHLPQEETPPVGQGTVDMTSFSDTVLVLSRNQVAEALMYQADSTWGCPEVAEDNASILSGSLSPDYGGTWRYGCTQSPD